MIRFFSVLVLVAASLLSSSARADECGDLVPLGMDARLFQREVEKCRAAQAQADLVGLVASGAEIDVDQQRQIDDIKARLAAQTAKAPAPPPAAATPSAPAQQLAQPTPPASQPVAYVPSGPVFGQPILPAVAVGSTPPPGGSSRPGIHISGGFVGAHRLPVSADWFVCATDGGVPIGIAGGVPIAIMAAGGQIVTRMCAPASAELNVFNLDVRREMGFALYRPSASYVGVFDLYATLSCPGSSSGFRQQFADGCPVHY